MGVIKRYLLVYSDCGSHTAIVIYAQDEYDAIIRAYEYIGEDYRLSSSEMRLLFSNCDIQRATEIFHNFSGTSIVWLSEIQNVPFVEKLKSITDHSSKDKDCSTCKNNVEYPPAHTCDICTSLDNDEEYSMWEPKSN